MQNLVFCLVASIGSLASSSSVTLANDYPSSLRLDLASDNDSARDPVGEKASYQLDRQRSRTSSLITGGEFKAQVVEKNEDVDGEISFRTVLHYQLRLGFFARKTGFVGLNIPADYFSKGFMEKLREEGSYETAQFTIRHLGRSDVRSKSGVIYKDADLIKIFDITTEQDYNDGINSYASEGSALEDLVVTAAIYPGVPVLGAVQIDVAGYYQGKRIRAGADYVVP